MHGVLQHGGISHYQQVEGHGVDGQSVGDGFGLWQCCSGVPVAQSHGSTGTLGHGSEQATGTGVALGGVAVYGVAAGGGGPSAVDGARLCVGVAVAAGEAGYIGRSEVGWVDAAHTTRRSEEAHTVAVVCGAPAVGSIIVVACGHKAHGVAGEWLETGKCVWGRRGDVDAERCAARRRNFEPHRGCACLLPAKCHALAFHLDNVQPVGAAFGQVNVVEIDFVVGTFVAEGNEVVTCRDTAEVDHTALPCGGGGYRGHGDERRCVGRRRHSPDGEGAAAVGSVTDIERHGDAAQRVGRAFRQGQDVGVVVVAQHAECAVAAVDGIALNVDPPAIFGGRIEGWPARRCTAGIHILKSDAPRQFDGLGERGDGDWWAAGGLEAVAAEVDVIGCRIAKCDVEGQAVDTQHGAVALRESCWAVFCVEAGFGPRELHHIVVHQPQVGAGGATGFEY